MMPSEASPTPSSSPVRNRLILLACWFAFYASFTLFVPPLLDDADSVHAEVAREMILRHDWVTLYANGIRYLEKAPLLYWSMAASFKLFGVSTAAARLPLSLTVLALALVAEAFARRAFHSARAGLYAGLILLSSFGIFIFSRILIPDVAVCLWLTLAIFCFWKTEQAEVPSRLACYGFAACCALNVLTKGLIGIVFPVAIVVCYLLLTRNVPRGTFRETWSRLRQLHPLENLAIFFAIAVPWHVLIALANPTQGNPGHLAFANGHWTVPLPTDGNVHGWAWFYFVNEQVLRYLNLRVPRDYDTVPLLLFWGLLLVWLMPWSVYLFHSLSRIRLRRVLDDRERSLLLLGVWAAVPMLFFSFSTRQEYYVLPSIPAFALLIAAWLNEDATVVVVLKQTEGKREGPGLSRATLEHLKATETPLESTRGPFNLRVEGSSTGAAWVLFVLATIASGAALFFAFAGTKPAADMDLASLLQQNPGDYALSFGHFLDLNRAAMGMFRVPLLLTAVALFVSTLANLMLRRRGKAHAANLVLAAGSFGFLLAAHLGLQIFSPVLTSRQLAAAIAPQLQPQDLVVIHGEYEAASTLGFYLHRNNIHI
ncbi:MAG: phospholipid carrier-dependent glycosyltransferase, partial [Granulicella sp.]